MRITRRTALATAGVAAAKPALARFLRAGSAPTPPPAQTITGITPTSTGTAAGATTGTVITTFSATLVPSSPAFSGTWGLSGADAAKFQMSGASLQVSAAGSPLGVGTYNIIITATQAGLTGSPFAQAVTINVSTTSLLVNGSTGPVTVWSDDDIWFHVTGAPGSGPNDEIIVFSSSTGTVLQLSPIPAGTSDFTRKFVNDSGHAHIPGGTYTARLSAPYPNDTADVTLNVNAYSTPPFQPIDPVQQTTTYQLAASPTDSANASLFGANVVHGTVTLNGTWGDNGGNPRPTNVTMQFMLNSTAVGAPAFSAAGTPSITFDTTTVADGTYILWAQVLRCQDTSSMSPHWTAYQLSPYPRALVVANGAIAGGPNDPTLTHTIPVAYYYGAFHCTHPMKAPPQTLTYHGIPQLNTAYPYPGPGQSIPQPLPAYNASSPYHSNPASLRLAANIYCTTVNTTRHDEYVSSMGFYSQRTTGSTGVGIFSGPFNAKNGGGNTLEGSYVNVVATSFLDGGRLANNPSVFSTVIGTPAGTPFYNSGVGHWTGVQLDGRVWIGSLDGTITTIAGPHRDTTQLPLFWEDTTNPEFPNSVFVGSIDTRALYNSNGALTDIAGGANDVCWDPRDPLICYTVSPIDHCVNKINFHTQTIGGTNYSSSNPLIQVYAGYKGGLPGGPSTGGYANGPALDPFTGGVHGTGYAQFSGPYSICMQQVALTVAGLSDPNFPGGVVSIGTMWIADNYNHLIRYVTAPPLDSNGNQTAVPVVGTLVGLAGGSTPPSMPDVGVGYGTVYNVTSLTLDGSGTTATLVLGSVNNDTRPSGSPAATPPGNGWKFTIQTSSTFGSGIYTGGGTSLEQGTYGIYTATAFNGTNQYTLVMTAVPTGTVYAAVTQADKYSAPLPTPFSSCYTIMPMMIRNTSTGDIVVAEAWYNVNCRLISLSGHYTTALNISRIGCFGDLHQITGGPSAVPNVNYTYSGISVDYVGSGGIGCCGPIDDILVFIVDSNPGSADAAWRLGMADGYSNYSPVTAGGPDFPVEGTGGLGHYPWAGTFSVTGARIAGMGLANLGLYDCHARTGVEPASPSSLDPYLHTLVQCANGNAQDVWFQSSNLLMPHGFRPTFSALYGINGQHWFGANVLPSIDDLWGLYPTDYAAGSGTIAASGTLARAIQDGLGGGVSRIELAMDDDPAPTGAPYTAPVPNRPLAALIYFLRRQSLKGSYPTPYPAPVYSLDCVRPVLTVQSGDPTRVDATHIRVRFTTDKNTIGIVFAGPPDQVGSAWPYIIWSALDTAYSTSHDITITIPDTTVWPTPTHVCAQVLDKAGNPQWTADFSVT